LSGYWQAAAEAVRQRLGAELEVQGWRGRLRGSGLREEEAVLSGGDFFPYFLSLANPLPDKVMLVAYLESSASYRQSLYLCTCTLRHTAAAFHNTMQGEDDASKTGLVQGLEQIYRIHVRKVCYHRGRCLVAAMLRLMYTVGNVCYRHPIHVATYLTILIAPVPILT
jgi:hypothetical protein